MPVDAVRLHRRDGLLATQVFDCLAEAIVDGSLAQDEPLDDREIAAAFGVSRTPVREAFQRLEQIGFVVALPHVETRVTKVTPSMVRDTLEFSGMQSSLAVAAACHRLTTDERVEACALIDTMIAAKDADALMGASRSFVQFMVQRCGNALLREVIITTRIVVLRNLRGLTTMMAGTADRIACYRAMQDAVACGDAEAAGAAFRRQHMLTSQRIEDEQS